MSGLSRFLVEAPELVNWCKNKALPLWMSVGIDEAGAFHERLEPCGKPDASAIRRVRVQCRQIYVFSQAFDLGWCADGADISDRATRELMRSSVMRNSDGAFDGVVNALGPDGSVIDPTRDLYTHAFLLLALAWRRRALGDEASIGLADEVIAYLDRRMGAGNGGWVESLPETTPRRQNPHMHLFEAFLALAEATGEDRYLARAADMRNLFEAVFFEAETGNLYEFFTHDWRHHPKEGDIVEPGHMMEWAWLLEKYADLSGDSQLSTSRRLYERALGVGRDPSSGLMVDRVSADGAPVWSRRRLWPQTEFLKAAIAMGRRGDQAAYGLAADIIEQMQATYLNVDVVGAWRDRYDERGGALPGPIPASSLYHIMCCVAEVDQTLQLISEPAAVSA